jgi:hypothetical protein
VAAPTTGLRPPWVGDPSRPVAAGNMVDVGVLSFAPPIADYDRCGEGDECERLSAVSPKHAAEAPENLDLDLRPMQDSGCRPCCGDVAAVGARVSTFGTSPKDHFGYDVRPMPPKLVCRMLSENNEITRAI